MIRIMGEMFGRRNVRHLPMLCYLSITLMSWVEMAQMAVHVAQGLTPNENRYFREFVKVLRPTRHRIDHFGNVLPSSQPISWLSIEKRKQTQQKQTCIRNKLYKIYNIRLTQKWSQVWSPPTTSGLETERVYSGRSR